MDTGKKKTNITIIIGAILAVLCLCGIVIAIIVIAIISRMPESNIDLPKELPVQVAPTQVAPVQGIPLSWDSPPPMTIDLSRQYFATVRMANGAEFVIQLYPNEAPLTVNNFVFLARQGFYDGTTFHRVLAGFMAQAGDPTGTGMGGPGYEFANEYSDLTFDKPGVVAMANAGPDTNGSQFFITFVPTEWLKGGYTIFGQVIEGMDVVNNITLRDPETSPAFEGDMIESITITEE